MIRSHDFAPKPDAGLNQPPNVPQMLRRAAPWRFIIWLVAPLALFSLEMKLARIGRQIGEFDPVVTMDLVRSDLAFYLGFAALTVAGFVVAKRPIVRVAVAVAAVLTGLGAAFTETAVHNYYLATGDAGLNYSMMLVGLMQMQELGPALISEVSPMVLAILSLLAVCLLWAFSTRPWRHRPPTLPTRTPAALSTAGLVLLAVALWPSAHYPDRSFSRGATLNALAASVELLVEPTSAEAHQLYRNVPEDFGIDARLTRTASPRRDRLVIVIMESVRARSVSLYDPALKTTPYLTELAKHGLVAERAYTVVPHTSKAIFAALCGIEPRLRTPITEAIPGSVPVRCLADLLREQGYRTAFFQSATEKYENRENLVANLGFESFFPLEAMDTEHFEEANYFGYEDDVMLERSEEWLRQQGADPFAAVYLTVTTHHPYLAPRRYGRFDFAGDDELNRYLNSVRYLDHFVANLVAQYKRLGLYDGTTFIIFGDHGEAFGEHGLKQHNDVMYDEVLQVPLLIHNPSLFPKSRRTDRPVNLLDIVPTVADILGFSIVGGQHPGSSILSAPPNRILRAHCWSEQRCMASIKGRLKFIHHFDRRPDEVFDLRASPDETVQFTGLNNATRQRMRDDLIAWRARINATHDGYLKRWAGADEP